MEVKFTSTWSSIPLLLLAIISFMAGILISQAQTSRLQVNGILGGSTLLSVEPFPVTSVKKIEWTFTNGSHVKIQLTEFREQKSERLSSSDRFKQRLEVYNKTSLRIHALELNDSGVYEARIQTVSALVEERAFLLTVYEPVPEPEIRSLSLSSTSEGCNVTLQCQVSDKKNATFSWRRGNPPQDLSDSYWYQLGSDSRTLSLSLQPNPPDSTFTCMASNPVSQRSISFDLQSVCQTKVDTGQWKWIICPMLLVSIAASACAGTWLWKRRKKPVDQAAVPTIPEEESLSELHYAQIVKRSPPEGNEPDTGCPRETPKRPLVTVYDQVRIVRADSSEQLT